MKRRVLAAMLAITVTAATLPCNVVYAAEETEAEELMLTEAAAEETKLGESEADAQETESGELAESEADVQETESGEPAESAETEPEETVAEELPETELKAEESAETAAEGMAAEENVIAEEQELKGKAVQNVSSGKCGENLTWSYSNGTLTISGTGDMYDFPVYDTPQSDQCMPWYYYKNQITTLNIEEGVTSIGSCAFWGLSALTGVTTPASLKSIGFAAFADCGSLSNVTVKAGKIGESAFIRCAGLRTVTIGRGVTAMGISAFENCNGMTGVYIEDVAAWCAIDFGGYLANPLEKARHLYLNGNLVTSLDIPAGVTSIGDYAFEYCADLTTVSIPSSVTEIGDYAFYLCSNLTGVALYSGLQTIGASAFDSTGITNVDIPETVSYIGTRAFSWTPIGVVNVNQGVIANDAFLGCGNIHTVKIGSGVTRIGDGAFDKCAGLGTVVGNVTYGGSRAQWRALDIGNNNDLLLNAPLTCTGTGSADTSNTNRSGVYVGATVRFGAYEQDGNAGKDALEWTVLDVQGDKALIITKNVIDFQRYYPNLQTAVTWENSSLRSWMNNHFIQEAFSDEQRNNIYTTALSNDSNPVYGTAAGAGTNDKVFALSAAELEKYMPYEEDRMAVCTTAAFSNGTALSGGADSALHSPELGTSYWWLRTPGVFDYGAMYVHYTGSARYDGMAAANTIVGVRPAMWVNKNAVEVMAENTTAPSEDMIETFVTRLYNVCLDRTPDEAGLNDWANRLGSGQDTGVTAAYGFIFSQEFQNKNLCNTDFVKQLYRAFMGREYDEGGLNDWVGRLQTGATREEVFNGFAQSAEFGALCAQYGITLGDAIDIPQYGTVPKGSCSVCGQTDGVTAFVTRLYDVCLNRTPDEGGLGDWTTQLWEHSKSGKDVSFGFIFSEEFTNKGLNDEDYVEYLYLAFFDRAADEAGKNDWLSRMHNEGYNREDVFNGFIGSAEFDNLCKRYGITRD